MTQILPRTLLACAVVALPLPVAALTAVDWTSGTGGTADGITVTMSDLEGSFLTVADLSGSRYEGAPLSASAEVVSYASRSDWTVTLSEPVDALLVYADAWRGTAAEVDPATYHFAAPFTILSGLINAEIVGNLGGLTLSLPANEFHDGILLFCGPLASVSLETNVPLETEAFQNLTLAVAPLPETPPAATPIDWTTPSAGVAGGIEASLSNLGDPRLEPTDLTGPDFSFEPLSFCTESISYSVGSDWTLTLSEPVDALLLYARFWRGSETGVGPVTYEFDSPFTIVSGLEGAEVPSQTLLSLSDNFHDGILRFDGPIEGLGVDTSATGASKQSMAFAVVPEPGAAAAALAALAALGVLRRPA
jgi:hypothetical protein